MKDVIKKIMSSLGRVFGERRNRRLSYLVLISLFALGDFFYSGVARRTFVFYSSIGGNKAVEDRMLYRSRDRETDIRRYVEQALLGPVSPHLELLFTRGTRLNTLMYRGSVVYADLTEYAALPLVAGTDVFHSLLTLHEGIRRNFSFVRDVRLFIGGNQVFFEEFHGIFANPADNSRTAP